MTDLDRAKDYVAIFLGVGDEWRNYAPVDSRHVTDRSMQLGTAFLTRYPDGSWWISSPELDRHVGYRLAKDGRLC